MPAGMTAEETLTRVKSTTAYIKADADLITNYLWKKTASGETAFTSAELVELRTQFELLKANVDAYGLLIDYVETP